MASKKFQLQEVVLYEKLSPATNNYFTCGREPFFFNDRSAESTQEAFSATMEFRAVLGSRAKITVYRRTNHRGPWDGIAGPVEE